MLGTAERETMMSVRCDATGRWRYRKWARHPDGRRERISGCPAINTKKAAEHAERVHVMRIENPSAVVSSSPKEVPTIREYSETFLSGYAAGDKPSEVVSKKQILNAYILKWFGEVALDQVLQSDVDAFRADLLPGRERKTVNNIVSVLSSLLRYAAKNGLRPAVDLEFCIDGDDTELVAVSAADVDALVVAAEWRYKAAILLAADAGLRVGEIRGLEWGDVNELRRTIVVARSIDPRNNVGAPKNRKRRTVPMSERLRMALRRVERAGKAVVARSDGKGGLGYYALREGLLAVYERAGVTPPPKPWHCLRHTFCTEMARAGVPVHVIKELAGHASIQTTLRYMHTSEADRVAAIAALAGGNGQMVGKRTGQGGKRNELTSER